MALPLGLGQRFGAGFRQRGGADSAGNRQRPAPAQSAAAQRHGLTAGPQPLLGWRQPCAVPPAFGCSTGPSSYAMHHQAAPCKAQPQQQRQQRQQQQRKLPSALPEAVLALAESPYRDSALLSVVVVLAAVYVKFFDVLTAMGFMDKKLSRKIVHTTTGPMFMLTWPLFSAAPQARLIAAVVPAINLTRLLLVGLGFVKDEGLIASVSRSGDRTELLRGPLYYCCVLIGVAILCWRNNPSGLIAVSIMCGGDGLADIVGRRLGKAKLPFNPNKSWAGSTAMFLGGLLMSYGLVETFCSLGFFACYSPAVMLPYIAFVCFVATLVEALPINEVIDDNLSVPVVAWGLALLLMPSAATAASTATAALSVL